MDSYGDTSGRIGRDWLDRHDEELEQELLDDELNLDELFGPEQEDAPGELSRRRYFRELFRLQRELVKLQNWVVHTGHKVVILFEGRDAAGTKAKETMLERTHIPEAPWWVVQADDKKRARLNCIHHLLQQMPYREVPQPPVHLPERLRHADYVRHPTPGEIIVPEVY
ncbi:hypothetical protein [Pseudomonas aeruginosa]|uniref:hypothetical protein n=1 Tax=Pseudomonas aeruginosa TaxID=287 RepID=UPI001052D915|nr:hypothetical protein [Pseudomonas aeruginosa]